MAASFEAGEGGGYFSVDSKPGGRRPVMSNDRQTMDEKKIGASDSEE